MGNRAVITTHPYKATNPAIYLHWNGGRASIEGFLLACKRLEYRMPEYDPEYAMARLTGLLCAFFPDGLSVGLGRAKSLANSGLDNGVYTIGGNWEIKGRLFSEGVNEEINPDKTEKIAQLIIDRINALSNVVDSQSTK